MKYLKLNYATFNVTYIITNVTRNSIEVVEPLNDIPTRVKCTATRVGALFLDVNYNQIRKLMLTGVGDSTS